MLKQTVKGTNLKKKDPKKICSSLTKQFKYRKHPPKRNYISGKHRVARRKISRKQRRTCA